MFSVYYESAVHGKHLIADVPSDESAKKLALDAYTFLCILSKSNLVKSVVCVSCYQDGDKLFQYGVI